jgi:pimeloyl-ACP methyl ester carboxylesterase
LEGTIPTADGTKIWYRMEGEGPTLICQNGVGVTTTFWRDAAARFARRGYRTILWDYRGHGQSDDPTDPAQVTLETCVDDLRTVLDALDVEVACLLGHSMGSQVGWEFYRAHPSRVAGLVPTLGTYRDAISSFFDLPQVAPRAFAAACYLVERFPRTAKRLASIPAARPALSEVLMRRLAIVHPTLSPSDWVPGYLEHMARLDPRVFFALAKGIRDHDASELLPTIEVPVLVVAGEKDFFCPPRVAHEMAEKIPGAELLIIPRGSHAAIIEQPHLFDLRLTRFLETRVYPA